MKSLHLLISHKAFTISIILFTREVIIIMKLEETDVAFLMFGLLVTAVLAAVVDAIAGWPLGWGFVLFIIFYSIWIFVRFKYFRG